jgi:hypothetical protein
LQLFCGWDSRNFLGKGYAPRSAKALDQYLPEFLTPDEIERFGKELDNYRSDSFRKEYLPKIRPFPKVRELFQRIHDDDKTHHARKFRQKGGYEILHRPS